jgi:hypothetical protein
MGRREEEDPVPGDAVMDSCSVGSKHTGSVKCLLDYYDSRTYAMKSHHATI